MSFFCIHCRSEIDPRFKACPFCGEPVTDFLRRYLQLPIDDKYQIISRLGVGGMGEVYKVLHVHLNAVRVIKLMRLNIALDPNAQERFLREARLATRIHHPNVATLYDFSSLDDDSWYTVWEYIDGTNLHELIADNGPLSPRHAATLAVQALHGLDAIHRAGIVHRDISPENLMVTRDDDGTERVKIIDLGIAKGVDPDDLSTTKTGMFVGKWKYCSPEHLGLLSEGESIDGRADLYSFGIVLYEALTGVAPFVSDSPHEYFLMHASQIPTRLRDVDPATTVNPELDAIVARALEKDRNLRFATARDFAFALERVIPSLSDEVSGRPRSLDRSAETTATTAVNPREATMEVPLEEPPAPIVERQVVRSAPAATTKTVGRFTLLEEIARGKSGRLFRAWDPMRRRMIGLKLVAADTEADEARMHKSAGVWLDMVHEHIVRIHEVREAGPDHGPLIITDLVDGVTLDRFAAETPLTLEQKIQLTLQICRALRYVHARGVLHREVKPANILVVREPMKALLLDSGIARPESDDPSSVTRAGSVVGDLHYMAPEQLAGQPEQRSDVFSLGAVLFFLLTRTAPTALDVRKMQIRLEECRDVPVAVREVVAKAIEPSLERRYESTAAFEAAMEDLLPRHGIVFPRSRTVVTLHGIRTHAKWQRAFSEVASEHNLACRLDRWNFGYFSTLRFIIPWTRWSRIAWFRRTYQDEFPELVIDRNNAELPSIIAHSFGTYILGYALLRYPYLRFNKVILCGSILPTAFPWSTILERGQVQAVRNEYGAEDTWTKIVDLFVAGTGASGISGFSESHPRLEQEQFSFSHSEYFERSHMQNRWLRFLVRPLPRTEPRDLAAPKFRTRKPWLLYAVDAAVVAAVTWGWLVSR